MRSYTDEKRILRMGDYGAASVVKIITNMLAGAHQVSRRGSKWTVIGLIGPSVGGPSPFSFETNL